MDEWKGGVGLLDKPRCAFSCQAKGNMPSRETRGENMLVATEDTKRFRSTLKWGHKGVREFSPKRPMRHHGDFVTWSNMGGKGAVGQAGTITECLFGKKSAFKEFIGDIGCCTAVNLVAVREGDTELQQPNEKQFRERFPVNTTKEQSNDR